MYVSSYNRYKIVKLTKINAMQHSAFQFPVLLPHIHTSTSASWSLHLAPSRNLRCCVSPKLQSRDKDNASDSNAFYATKDICERV